MISTLIDGFLFSLSLILAIGAQNAFVLRQGMMGKHIFWICMICACSDALLIQVGVFGLAAIEDLIPSFALLMRYGGAAFLCIYGILRLRSAWQGGESLKIQDGAQVQSLKSAVLTALAMTWLNPHVYLDTVMLLGSVASNYRPWQQSFAIGASLASFCFFFSLGYGAASLRRYLARPAVWRIIEVLIGIFMLYLAVHLLFAP